MEDRMTITEENRMAAPCGTYCAVCPCAKAGEDRRIMETFLAKGFPREKLPCPGCRKLLGECPAIEPGTRCVTYDCIAGRGLDFCHECADFPCGRLSPAAHRADVLPHNIKIFHLCYQARHGLEAWKKEAEAIQERYYKGVMRIGEGPAIGRVGREP
jgi:hypothetical protein